MQKHIVTGGALETRVRKAYPLDKLAEALADYNANMADGKICIGPSME